MKKGILASLMAVSMRLDVLAMRYGLTMDASYPKDPDPKNWRTINHSKVHLSGGRLMAVQVANFMAKHGLAKCRMSSHLKVKLHRA